MGSRPRGRAVMTESSKREPDQIERAVARRLDPQAVGVEESRPPPLSGSSTLSSGVARAGPGGIGGGIVLAPDRRARRVGADADAPREPGPQRAKERVAREHRLHLPGQRIGGVPLSPARPSASNWGMACSRTQRRSRSRRPGRARPDAEYERAARRPPMSRRDRRARCSSGVCRRRRARRVPAW